MRVLYVITSAGVGGAQAHLLSLLQASLAKEVGLVAGEAGPLIRAAAAIGVSVWVLPSLVRPICPSKDFRALRELRGIIRAFRPTIVHAHSSKAGVIGRLAARLEGVPAIFTAHGWAFSEGFSLHRRILAVQTERIAAQWAERIITVSEYDRLLALRYHVADQDKLTTIHNGIPDVPFRAEPGPCSRPTITMVARLAPPKDPFTILSACRLLRGSYRLQIVGDGPLLTPARRMTRELGLEGQVEFLGARLDVPLLLSRSHIFVLVSRSEGLPISILEAMRAGLPVVATNVGGVSECVADEKNGYLVPCGDEGTLARKLQKLLDQPALRSRMGTASRYRYEAKFTEAAMLDQVRAVYTKLTLHAPHMT